MTWFVFIFSLLVILSHSIFHMVLAAKGEQWSVADAQWATLIGFLRYNLIGESLFSFAEWELIFHEDSIHINVGLFCSVQSWISPSVIYLLVIQALVAFVALIEIYGGRFRLVVSWRDSCFGQLGTSVIFIG